MSATLTVRSVNVGTPRRIGTKRDQAVLSAIGKKPVLTPRIQVGWLNLAGDDQADRTVHGGADKAVYVYPSEHYAFWETQGVHAGTFGENITSEGLCETDVHLGDRWRWGTAELIVTQPRTPCYKLAMHLARKDAARLMIDTTRCGWYLRVVRPGTAATTEPMHRIEHRADLPTIADTFNWALTAPRDPHNITRLLATPELATQFATAIAGLAG